MIDLDDKPRTEVQQSLTRRIEKALQLLDIRCLDHLIVNGDQWRALRSGGSWTGGAP